LEDNNKLLAREHLTLQEFVGKGNFGSVFKAKLYITSTNETQEVAVKTLQESREYF